jgi:hypothetical protein
MSYFGILLLLCGHQNTEFVFLVSVHLTHLDCSCLMIELRQEKVMEEADKEVGMIYLAEKWQKCRRSQKQFSTENGDTFYVTNCI